MQHVPTPEDRDRWFTKLVELAPLDSCLDQFDEPGDPCRLSNLHSGTPRIGRNRLPSCLRYPAGFAALPP